MKVAHLLPASPAIVGPSTEYLDEPLLAASLAIVLAVILRWKKQISSHSGCFIESNSREAQILSYNLRPRKKQNVEHADQVEKTDRALMNRDQVEKTDQAKMNADQMGNTGRLRVNADQVENTDRAKHRADREVGTDCSIDWTDREVDIDCPGHTDV